MEANQDQIAALLQKLELLLKKQQDFNIEVNEIRRDIQILRNTQTITPIEANKEPIEKPLEKLNEKDTVNNQTIPVEAPKPQPTKAKVVPAPSVTKKFITKKGKSNLEKFIGENLINKVGILITVIGVVIGAKYSIENNLISPLTRIILGYLVGLALLGFGFKLKVKYESYSAVLVSGAIAILYFITFAAYDFYALFPQVIAFGIMLLCTVFGVVAALNYNRQVIAHIGLVGAYAVPFLLSNNTGNALVLFTYMAIINIGILVISLKKYWKALYYVSFIFTWLIYGGWSIFSRNNTDFNLAFSFLLIFFLIFYITFLAFKILKAEQFKTGDIVLIFFNSFIFYGLGIYLLYSIDQGASFLGLFTLANAVIHFLVTLYIYRKKLVDKNLFYLTSGFVLTFITIAIPVQLDGNWVTLIWVSKAALLFWIGRTKKVSFYEHLSYIMIALATFSLIIDWSETYLNVINFNEEINATPFLNTTLLTSLLCAFSFGFMSWLQLTYNIKKKTIVSKIMLLGLPTLFIVTLYLSFYLEIDYFWNRAYEMSKMQLTGDNDNIFPEYNYNLVDLGTISKLVYSLLFTSLLCLVNAFKLKNRILGIVSLCAALLFTITFLTNGLFTLSELRENYLNQDLVELYNIGNFNLYFRYIGIGFFAFLLYSIHTLAKQDFMKLNFKIPFEILKHIAIIWVVSSELLNWMDLAGSQQSYKLGLSILWGLYALLLIALGIWKNKKYLRIGAIVLFSFTLIKLFFYDISSLTTISKTIVFVSLGILLLIISFLYNKYKHIISDEVKK